jgi:hypothetical protein
MDQTLNLNQAHGIQEVHNIGSTAYVNICAHTTQIVTWGVGDWIGAVAMGVGLSLLGLLVLGIVFMFFSMVREMSRGRF